MLEAPDSRVASALGLRSISVARLDPARFVLKADPTLSGEIQFFQVKRNGGVEDRPVSNSSIIPAPRLAVLVSQGSYDGRTGHSAGPSKDNFAGAPNYLSNRVFRFEQTQEGLVRKIEFYLQPWVDAACYDVLLKRK